MPLETVDIPAVEVFAAGTWNGETYDVADLDAMVEAFAATKDALKPYLKLGHKGTPGLTDGLPALGWLGNVRRVGSKLVADFSRVPAKLGELIRSGAYRRVSAEVYWNITVEGKKWPYALKAVAILGGDTPAVSTLNDIMALYAGQLETVKAYDNDAATRTHEYEPANHKESEMEKELKELAGRLETVEKKFTQAEETNKALAAENANLKTGIAAAEKRAIDAETSVSEFRQKANEAEVTAAVDKLIADKKIVPAQKESVLAVLMAAKQAPELKSYSKDGKGGAPLFETTLKAFSDGPAAGLPTEEESEMGKDASGDDLDSKAQEYAAKHKVSYRDALIAVAPKQKAE